MCVCVGVAENKASRATKKRLFSDVRASALDEVKIIGPAVEGGGSGEG